jgi:hypothetical protein
MADETAPLRGLDEWRAATHRPVLLIGNGPSAEAVDPRRLPENPVVVRMNAFMLEQGYPFGDRVDGFFWAVARRWLQVAVGLAQARGDYRFGTFFSPVKLAREGLHAFRAEAASLAGALQPRLSHFDLLRADERLAGWFGTRGERPRPGLPTQGLQALATLLCLGFREIHVAGMDFYQSAARRYAFPYPDFIREMMAPVHVTPGYESSHHGLLLDIEFFLALRCAFPDAAIHSLTEEGPLAGLAALSPPRGAAPPPATRARDREGFVETLREACHAPFRAGLVGEVARLGEDRLLLWAWHPDQPALRRAVDMHVNGVKVRTLVARQPVFELELGCVGDARHGLLLSRAALRTEYGEGLVTFVDQLTGIPLAGGMIAPLACPRTDLPDRAAVILTGRAPLSEAERAAISGRAAIDRLLCVPPEAEEPGLPASLPAEARAEIAAMLHILRGYPDRVLRPAGLSVLRGGDNALVTLAAEAPQLARVLLDGFAEGRAAALVPSLSGPLSALDLMMQPLLIVTGPIGRMTPAQAARVSVPHALLQALPLAQRLDLGLWGAGVADTVSHLPPNGRALLDGAGVLAMPAEGFSELLGRLEARGAPVLLHLDGLPDDAEGTDRAERDSRLRRLAGIGARMFSPSPALSRALALLAGSLPVETPPPAPWIARRLEPRERIRCALLVAHLTPALQRRIRRLAWALPPALQGRFRLDVVPEAMLGEAGAGTLEGEGITLGTGLPDPAALGGHDLAILAAPGLGAGLAGRFAAMAGVPVLATAEAGGTESLPPDAVLPSLEEAVLAAAGLAEGRALIAARPARDGVAMLEADRAALLRALFPEREEGVAPVLAARPILAVPAGLRGLGEALTFVLATPAAMPGESARFSLLLRNGAETWLPRAVGEGEGLRVELRVVPEASMAAPMTVRRGLPHDLAPGDTAVLHFTTPRPLPVGTVGLSMLVGLGPDRPVISRELGAFQIRGAQ